MKISRRTLLKTASVLGAAIPLAGCEKILSRISHDLGQSIPEHLQVGDAPEIDPLFHLLSRAAYGPWPGEFDRLKAMGKDAWIDEQLSPEKIDDRLCDLHARRCESVLLAPGNCYDFKKEILRQDIMRHTLLRAIYSKRQLYEVMVGFWSDHLNINLEKGDCIYLKAADDRQVVRAHALGKFKDMIRASATSPAMLVYLDGKENKKANPSDIPNENYGRELLELHTLGVNGGYSQKDVFEVARCLTGWRLRDKWQKGTVYFDPKLHDDGQKTVLGQVIAPGGGEKDLDRVVEIACAHPSAANHIATKLVRRFVCEDPPEKLVRQVADVFLKTDGDIKSMLRSIFAADEFWEQRGTKIKRPFHYIVSCLRATGADTYAHQDLIEYLMRMGQGLFEYPTPDGYPDKASHWLGTLLWRWNFALSLIANEVPSVTITHEELVHAIQGQQVLQMEPEKLLPYFIGRSGTKIELKALRDYLSSGKQGSEEKPQIAGEKHEVDRAERFQNLELLGVILASPAFQRY
jgi:uncharacterized protein (DUF1800 family)